MKIKKLQYRLVEADYPLLNLNDFNIIIDSINGRGERLTYEKTTSLLFQISIFGYKINIPLLNSDSTCKIIFFKPYKQWWGEKYWKKNGKKERIPHNYWGKKDHPLTRMWFKLNTQKDKSDDFVYLEKQIKDHILEKHLNNRDKQFQFIINLK